MNIFLFFLFRFASITINLGPTFLSGALAANSESHLNKPSCPLIQGPFRHYVLNVLWIFINLLCVLLTMYHLYKLYKDLSRSNLEAVRVATLVTTMISVQSPERGLLDQVHESFIQLGPLGGGKGQVSPPSGIDHMLYSEKYYVIFQNLMLDIRLFF
jgi:hypothetical protein